MIEHTEAEKNELAAFIQDQLKKPGYYLDADGCLTYNSKLAAKEQPNERG